MTIDTSREAVERLLAERDAALAEVARLSTPPDDAVVAEMVERLIAAITDDYGTLPDVAEFEAVAGDIRQAADALTSQAHALAAERKLADDAKRLLEVAQDRCGHNFVGAEYPTFVDFCDAHAARRNEETLAKHGSKT